MNRCRLVLILDAEIDGEDGRWHADVELIERSGKASLTEKVQQKLVDYAAEAIREYRENGLG